MGIPHYSQSRTILKSFLALQWDDSCIAIITLEGNNVLAKSCNTYQQSITVCLSFCIITVSSPSGCHCYTDLDFSSNPILSLARAELLGCCV